MILFTKTPLLTFIHFSTIASNAAVNSKHLCTRILSTCASISLGWIFQIGIGTSRDNGFYIFIYIVTLFFKKALLIYFPSDSICRTPISLQPQQKWILSVFHVLGKS